MGNTDGSFQKGDQYVISDSGVTWHNAGMWTERARQFAQLMGVVPLFEEGFQPDAGTQGTVENSVTDIDGTTVALRLNSGPKAGRVIIIEEDGLQKMGVDTKVPRNLHVIATF